MDIYDEAINHLTKCPNNLKEMWTNPGTHFSGALFLFLDLNPLSKIYGCPSTVSLTCINSASSELDKYIRNQQPFPDSLGLTIGDLPRFADAQRKADELIRGRYTNVRRIYD